MRTRWRAWQRSRAKLIENDARGDGHVERLDGRADGDRDELTDALTRLARQTSALVADDDREAVRRLQALERRAIRFGAPHRDRVARAERIELHPGTHECTAVKEGAHRTSDDLGVPQVNRAGHRDDGRRAERRRGPENGADVAGVLDGVEDDEAGSRGELEIGEVAVGD